MSHGGPEIEVPHDEHDPFTKRVALSVAIFGGSAPYLSIWMIEKLGTPIAPVWYLIAAAVVSFCVIWSLKETAHDELA